MPDDEIDEYLAMLAEIAEASGGGITDPPQSVGDCPDSAAGAFLMVTADADLTAMWPWRGRSVIKRAQFASLEDASRRSRRAPALTGLPSDGESQTRIRPLSVSCALVLCTSCAPGLVVSRTGEGILHLKGTVRLVLWPCLTWRGAITGL